MPVGYCAGFHHLVKAGVYPMDWGGGEIGDIATGERR